MVDFLMPAETYRRWIKSGAIDQSRSAGGKSVGGSFCWGDI